MFGVGEDVALSLGVADQVLTQDLLLVQDLHSIILACLLPLFLPLHDLQLLHQIHYAERPLTQLHHRFKVKGSD